MPDQPQSRPPHKTNGRRVLVFGGVALALLLVATFAVLRSRSDYPGSAKAAGQDSVAVPQANKTVQKHARKFVELLAKGDTESLKALAYSKQDANTAAAFVSAYGNRQDQVSSVLVDDFGGQVGSLNIAVPCKGSAPISVTVPFKWKRTGLFSSDWFAILNAPGSNPLIPAPCSRP